jgi:hypothetical protein
MKTMSKSKIKPPGAPKARRRINANGHSERPEGLRGLHKLEIDVLYTYGLMAESEKKWYGSRCMTKTLNLSPINWML